MKKRFNPHVCNLTKTVASALLAPESGREEIRDSVISGLRIRITSTGAKSWSVYRRVKNGEPVRVTIGDVGAITPTIARLRAREIITGLALGIPPTRRLSVKAKALASREKKSHTLEALAMAYVEFQKVRGRSSFADARSIFNLHLVGRDARLANKAAAEVTAEEVGDLLRAVRESGKGRTANKLRAYLQAAYAVALASRTDHTIPVAFKGYDITVNPVAATKADSEANKADKNPVLLPELRAYWKAIEHAEGREGAMLRVHLLTGGQRIEQLIRIEKTDIRDDSIVLTDNKGRKREDRQHVIPLTPLARASLDELMQGDIVFSRTGDRRIEATGLTRIATKHVAGVIDGFTLKRIRSGVETLLAQRGVSEEIRGRLQSHGVAGVQSKHYNAYDYFTEKLAALQLFEAALTSTKAKIVAIRA
jgi:integrase